MEEISMEDKIDLIIELVEIYGTNHLTLESNEERLCRQLRETFASKSEFDDYELSNNTNGTIKFPDYIKGAIYDTLSPRHKQIIEQWRSLQNNGRKRTDEEDKIFRKKKNIYDNILVRYKKIVMRTFGPTCLRCDRQDKWAFTTNCKCVDGGVCQECIREGCVHITDTDSYKYYCERCYNRVMIYKDVYKNVHSLNSLFGYNETALDENDNDDFLEHPPSRKRRRQVLNRVLVPVPDPAPAQDQAPPPVPVPARARARARAPVPGPAEAPVKDINYYRNLNRKYRNQLIKFKKTIAELRSENGRLLLQINA